MILNDTGSNLSQTSIFRRTITKAHYVYVLILVFIIYLAAFFSLSSAPEGGYTHSLAVQYKLKSSGTNKHSAA